MTSQLNRDPNTDTAELNLLVENFIYSFKKALNSTPKPAPLALHGASQQAAVTLTLNSALAARIDHTLLRADASRDEVRKLCEEARAHGFATVCVNSAYVAYAAELLNGASTFPIAVVGFPLGANLTQAKSFEAQEAIACGAREIDMVINIGALKSKDYGLAFNDIQAVVIASAPYPVKVILETSLLNDDEKVIACALAKAAGAAFVKTSTGFGTSGASVADVALMRKVVGSELGVKASGGIRTCADAVSMIEAGATRLGVSASIAIVTQKKTHQPKGY